MELIQYLRILRRGWPVIVLLTLVGVGVGWYTTPSGGEAPTTFYRGTHTLLTTDREGVTRTAYLLTVGEVPVRVATLLAQDPARLAHEVQVTADSSLGTIAISTIQPDPALAQQIVDTYASEFQANATEQANANLQQSIAQATANTEAIRLGLEALGAQVLAAPDNLTLQAARDAERARYEAAYLELQGLLARGAPSSGFRSLGPALVVASASGNLEPPPGGEARRGPVQAFRGADPEGNPPQPVEAGDPIPRSVAGGLVGLFLAVGLALLLDRLDTRIRTAQGAEAAFGAPVLAEVPALSRRLRRRSPVMVHRRPGSAAAEAYRRLRTLLGLMPTVGFEPVLDTPATNGAAASGGPHGLQIANSPKDPHWRVVLVTSAGQADGKSFAVANLAAAFAEGGDRVLVFDCDYRRSSLHRLLQPRDEHSLAGSLWPGASDRNGWSLGPERGHAAPVPGSEASPAPGVDAAEPGLGTPPAPVPDTATAPGLDDVVAPTRIPNVWLVRATHGGEAIRNPSDLLAHQRRLISAARDHADVILLDTPPLLATNDVYDLLPEADMVLLVARPGKTRRDSAMRVSELLRRVRAPVVGLALVGGAEAAHPYFADREALKPLEADTQPAGLGFTEGAPAQREAAVTTKSR